MRIVRSVSVPAGGTDNTILNGTQYQFAPVSGMANFLATASATGITLNITIGTETVLENSVVNAANRVPQTFEDAIATGIEIDEGEQVIATFSNPTVAAITIFFAYEIEETDEFVDVI